MHLHLDICVEKVLATILLKAPYEISLIQILLNIDIISMDVAFVLVFTSPFIYDLTGQKCYEVLISDSSCDENLPVLQ